MNPWITTFTGKQVDLLDPQPDQIDILDIAHALSLLCRFTGHVRSFYSVAQHSVLVSRHTALPAELRLLGLMHDAHEAYLADWSTPLKKSLSKDVRAELKQIEMRLMECIGTALGIRLGHHPLVKSVDSLALAAEAATLMPGPLDGVETRKNTSFAEIWPWKPQVAEYIFHAEFLLLKQADRVRKSESVMPQRSPHAENHRYRFTQGAAL